METDLRVISTDDYVTVTLYFSTQDEKIKNHFFFKYCLQFLPVLVMDSPEDYKCYLDQMDPGGLYSSYERQPEVKFYENKRKWLNVEDDKFVFERVYTNNGIINAIVDEVRNSENKVKAIEALLNYGY